MRPPFFEEGFNPFLPFGVGGAITDTLPLHFQLGLQSVIEGIDHQSF
jgi:hypothetical protein